MSLFGKKKKVECLVASQVKFWRGDKKLPVHDEVGQAMLWSDKVLELKRKNRSTKLKLKGKVEMTREEEDRIELKADGSTFHIVFCDEDDAYWDWYLELSAMIPDLDFWDDFDEKEAPKAHKGQKQIFSSKQKFGGIPVMLLKGNKKKDKSYLLTKTLKKQFDLGGGFHGDDKLSGSFGKFRAAMELKGGTLLAVKEVRHKDKGTGFTRKTKRSKLNEEIEVMTECKCRIKVHDIIGLDQKTYCIMDFMDGDLENFTKWSYEDILKPSSHWIQSKSGGKSVQDPGGVMNAHKWIGRFILKEMAYDLRACHRAGYAHKDIKAGNVFVARDRVVLGDYGEAQEKSNTDFRGSPGYMTPLNYELERVDATVDVYNIGLTWLYYMIQDHLAFVVRRATEHYGSLRTGFDKVFRLYMKKRTKPSSRYKGWHDAAVIFAYFYESYYSKKGELKKKLPKDLQRWQAVEDQLARARTTDPELFAYVWERMLVQDDKKRATADEVGIQLNKMYKKAPRSTQFNNVIDNPTALFRRTTLRQAFKEAQKAFSDAEQEIKDGKRTAPVFEPKKTSTGGSKKISW